MCSTHQQYPISDSTSRRRRTSYVASSSTRHVSRLHRATAPSAIRGVWFESQFGQRSRYFIDAIVADVQLRLKLSSFCRKEVHPAPDSLLVTLGSIMSCSSPDSGQTCVAQTALTWTTSVDKTFCTCGSMPYLPACILPLTKRLSSMVRDQVGAPRPSRQVPVLAPMRICTSSGNEIPVPGSSLFHSPLPTLVAQSIALAVPPECAFVHGGLGSWCSIYRQAWLC